MGSKRPGRYAQAMSNTYKRGLSRGFQRAVEETEATVEQTIKAAMLEAGLTRLILGPALRERLGSVSLAYQHDPEEKSITYTLIDVVPEEEGDGE